MSIRSLVLTAPAIVGVATAPGAALAQAEAQDSSPEEVAAQLIEDAKTAYTLAEPEPERPADCVVAEDETSIVVCAPVEDDPERFRGPSRLDRGDDSHLSWDGSAPYVGGKGIFTGPATVGGLCIVGPCPPPPVYYIDVAALPEAPPGSDADRIARGLAPRGSRYDEGEAMAEGRAREEAAGAVVIAGAEESAADRSGREPEPEPEPETGPEPEPQP